MRSWSFVMVVPMVCASLSGSAQKVNQQSWNDLVLRKRVSTTMLTEGELSYRILLDDDQKWWSLNFTPALVWSVNRQWDLIPRYSMRYTVQGYNTVTWEHRAQFGARYHFSPNARFRFRALVRNEQRFFTVVGPERSNEYSSRTRFRAELVTPIRATTDRWYAVADFEAFVVLTDALSERFSDRNRLRIGTGYRFTPDLIGEFNYGYQRSVNELDPRGYTADGIIRFRFIYFVAPRKRSAEPPPEPEEIGD